MDWGDTPAKGDAVVLVEAVMWLGYQAVTGCACIGTCPGLIPRDTICICKRATVESLALKHRAAIVAGLFNELKKKKEAA